MAPNTAQAETEGSKEDDRPASAKSDSSWTSWNTYNFEWLFDVNRIDHLPIEEQLKLFKQPDLRRTKAFKIARKLFGDPQSRKRKIIASMIPADSDLEPVTVPSIQTTSALKPQLPPPRRPSSAEIREQQERQRKEEHSKWLSDRMAFRQNMDTLGVSEQWLANKPDRTALENKVLKKMIADRNPPAPSPPPEIDPAIETNIGSESPVIQRPSPLAIRIIERYLQEKKMRLIDLFQTVDKDKDWMISREEFRHAIKEAGIPISEVLLEDLILSLDTNLDNELDYRELATGMGLWKVEKREAKKKMAANVSRLPNEIPIDPDLAEVPRTLSPVRTSSAKSRSRSGSASKQRQGSAVENSNSSDIYSSPLRMKSALSTISSESSFNYLEVPEADQRPEQMMLSSDEAMVDMRKRDRETLARYNMKQKAKENSAKLYYLSSPEKAAKAPSDMERSKTILTGDKAIDNHCRLSTLEGETGRLVNQFRQLKMREYEDICTLCRERNIPLSEGLLKKALLHPPDCTKAQIDGKVRQPTEKLLPTKFATRSTNSQMTSALKSDPQKEIIEQKTKRKTYKDLYGPSSYPTARSKAPRRFKMHLPTGKAIVSRQVDCWLTYEEYERLTRHLSQKYQHMYGPSDDNAFWPGHLLKKMKLCMDNFPESDNRGALFNQVRQSKRSNPGYHNDLNTWASDMRCVKFGSIDK